MIPVHRYRVTAGYCNVSVAPAACGRGCCVPGARVGPTESSGSAPEMSLQRALFLCPLLLRFLRVGAGSQELEAPQLG